METAIERAIIKRGYKYSHGYGRSGYVYRRNFGGEFWTVARDADGRVCEYVERRVDGDWTRVYARQGIVARKSGAAEILGTEPTL